jgi:hypothetical protein
MVASDKKRLTTMLPAFFAAALCVLPAAGQSSGGSPSSAEINRWIDDLGADSYTVRQSAADRLMNGGFAARAALGEVADAPDPEIRAAARRLITLIDQNEFSRQLAEFAADVDGRRGITLPGWQEFGSLVGQDEAARALFVEMQREEAPLLAQMFEQPNGGRDVAWDDHLARLMNWRIASQQGGFRAPLGSCATMFFLGSLPDTKISDPAAGQLVQLAQLPPVGELLTTNRPENAVRRLVSAWVVDCPSHSDQVLQLRLALLINYQLTEALPLAKAVARHDPEFLTVFPPQRVNALLAVGKLGSAKDVPDLEPLLEDRTEYLRKPLANRPQGYEDSVQIRDVALATMLRLTGQEPIAYGYLHARPHPQSVFDPASLGMESDDVRNAAAAKWRAWRIDHPLDSDDAR